MPSPTSPDRRPAVVGFVPILLANLVPLVGVVRFGWDPATLVVIYALEVLLSFPLAAGKALFAQRPPRTDRDDSGVISVSSGLTRKRGSVELVSWLPPVHPRTVPFAVAVLGAAAWFWIFAGVTVAETVPVAEALAQPEVVLTVGALFAGQSLEVWRDYFRDGRHETASPYAVIETPTRQAFFLVFVLFAVPPIAVAGPDVVLGAFVAVKLLVEWSAFRATHGDGGRLSGWLAGPDEATEPVAPPRVPDGEPDARVPTDGTAVLYTGVLRTLSTHAPVYAMWFLVAWLVSAAIFGGWPSPAVTIGSGLAVLGLFGLLLAVRAAEFVFEYGPLEYRRYGDRLVAYDRWLEEPQWSVPRYEVRDAEVVRDRLPDRLFDARTVAATTGWADDEAERHLGPVADLDALVDDLELPVRKTDLELAPPERRLVAAAAVSTAGIVAVPFALAVGPWPPLMVLLYTAFLLPLAVVVPQTLWRWACSNAA